MRTETLSEMVTHYAATALWSSFDESDNPLDEAYDLSDIAPATSAAGKQTGSLTGDGAVNVQAIKRAFETARDGTDWRRTIENAGYSVFQAI